MSPFLGLLGRRTRFPVPLGPARGRKPDELEVFALVSVGERRRAVVEPLDEVDLSLVLPCPGSLDGPPFPGERHVPALVLGVLEGRVIIL